MLDSAYGTTDKIYIDESQQIASMPGSRGGALSIVDHIDLSIVGETNRAESDYPDMSNVPSPPVDIRIRGGYSNNIEGGVPAISQVLLIMGVPYKNIR